MGKGQVRQHGVPRPQPPILVVVQCGRHRRHRRYYRGVGKLHTCPGKRGGLGTSVPLGSLTRTDQRQEGDGWEQSPNSPGEDRSGPMKSIKTKSVQHRAQVASGTRKWLMAASSAPSAPSVQMWPPWRSTMGAGPQLTFGISRGATGVHESGQVAGLRRHRQRRAGHIAEGKQLRNR